MLSARGKLAINSPTNPLWTILGDPYCSKTNAAGFINLGVAENNLMYDELVAHLKAHFDPPISAFAYGSSPGGSLRLRNALAAFFNQYFRPYRLVEAHHINVSNGVTASLERCAFELGDPGDIFLLGRPYYGSYPSDIGDRAGIKTLPVSFGEVDPTSIDAVRCYETTLLRAKDDPLANGSTRAMILCSPHNPLGQCYPRQTLEAILKLCQKYRIHLICDEIYALSVFENPIAAQSDGFTSILSIDMAKFIDPALVHVLWGLSKDFGANGMRIGCVVSQENPELITALNTHGAYSYPSAMLEYMACCILEDRRFVDSYIASYRQKLRMNFLFVANFLGNHGIPFHAATNAGMFIWANFGKAWRSRMSKELIVADAAHCNNDVVEGWVEMGSNGHGSCSIDEMIRRRFAAYKLYLSPGNTFGSEREGWCRIVFSQDAKILNEGLLRMVSALGLQKEI